jgi:uncharacterized delta-60 repeat protein
VSHGLILADHSRPAEEEFMSGAASRASITRVPGAGRSVLARATLAALLLAASGCNRPPDKPPRVTHVISGTVSGAPASGVTLSLTGAWTASTTTDASGSFRFEGLANGNYALAPSADGCAFSPASLAVTVKGYDVTNVAFAAAASTGPTYIVSGTISGLGGSGVTVFLSGDGVGSVTTESGRFVFGGIANGHYTVTPSDPHFVFDPPASTVTVSGADVGAVDFSAAAGSAPTYSVSGTVSGAIASDVPIVLTGGTIATTTVHTDAAGRYTFTELGSGSYVLTPSNGAYVFEPPSIPVTLGAADVAGVNFVSTLRGAPGALDDGFDGDGILTDGANGNGSTFYAVVVQSDGNILAGGVKGSGGWLIRRFQRDGKPDATFNANAAAAMPTSGELHGLAIDPNTRRLVLIGWSMTSSGNNQLTVVRLNTNGTSDTAFANSGSVVFDQVEYPNGSSGYAALVLSDSSIVVAGARKGGTTDYALLEHLDATDGGRFNGFTRFLAGNSSVFNSVGLWQGQIVAGGADGSTSPPSTLIIRTSSTGVLDASFGAGGIYSSNDQCRANGMAVQPSGFLAVAGRDITGPRYCVARATDTGASAWHVTDYNGDYSSYTGVAAAADDKIVVVGRGGGTYDKLGKVVRLLPGGAYDTSFGGGGAVTFEDKAQPDSYWYWFYAVALQADGKIVAAGNKNNGGATLVRLWP